MGFSRQEYWSGVPLSSPSLCYSPSQNKVLLSIPTVTHLDMSVTSCHKGRRHRSLNEVVPACVRSVWSPAPASRTTVPTLFLSFLHLRTPPLSWGGSWHSCHPGLFGVLNLPDQLSWTIKKAEHGRADAFELWLENSLESPLDCKEIQPVYPKGNQS